MLHPDMQILKILQLINNRYLYLENLIIRLHVLYILNTHIKFHVNWILFTIRFINLFLCIILDYKNLKFKYLIDDIVINL